LKRKCHNHIKDMQCFVWISGIYTGIGNVNIRPVVFVTRSDKISLIV